MKVIYKELTKQLFKRLPHYVRRRTTVKVHGEDAEGGFSLQTITNWRADFSVSAVFSINPPSSNRRVPSKALFLLLLRYNNVHKMKWNKKVSCLRCPLSAQHIHANRVITLITNVNNKLALFKIQWQQRQKSNTCIL